jgi:CheY-like chemotaxis protein
MANDATILLVEDNPLVAGMLQGALAHFGNVVLSADGADGLMKAAELLPDLIVSDYALPAMDGLRFLQKLRTRAATENISFVMMATKIDIDEKLKPARELAEEIIEKPFLLEDAMVRIRRALERAMLRKVASQPAAEGSIRGQLSQLGAIDLVQALELGRKTCRLTLTSGLQRCDMFAAEGQLVHATCGELVGEAAVYAGLQWGQGEFEMDFAVNATQRTISRSTQALLMEGMRLLDETHHAQDVRDR